MRNLRGPSSGYSGGATLIQRTAAAVVGVLVLVGAALLGTVVLLLSAGLVLIAGVVIGLRLWWIRRTLTRQVHTSGSGTAGRPGSRTSGETIEGEYRNLDRD